MSNDFIKKIRKKRILLKYPSGMRFLSKGAGGAQCAACCRKEACCTASLLFSNGMIFSFCEKTKDYDGYFSLWLQTITNVSTK